jgi:hypothetical protein
MLLGQEECPEKRESRLKNKEVKSDSPQFIWI